MTMVCEVCKENQATVHLTEIANEQMSELHLCEACANQKGAQVESHFGLANLLSGLAEATKLPETEEAEAAVKTCPSCGMSYDDFRKVGRLGCADCYPTFKRNLGSLLKRIHGSPMHVGKSPSRLLRPAAKGAKAELQELKRNLERAIEQEEFEAAAALRDQIRRMEHQEQSSKPKR